MSAQGKQTFLSRYLAAGLLYKTQDPSRLQKHIQTVEDTEFLRAKIPQLGYVAFVGNGSVLPRSDHIPVLAYMPTLLKIAPGCLLSRVLTDLVHYALLSSK